jgi:hypothetical protein
VAPSAKALGIFGSTSSGAIGGAEIDGTGVNQSLITGITGPGGVAVDGTHIHWVSNDIPHITSAIGRVKS